MTLDDLIDAFRIATHDTVEPYLWSDDEIEMYLNEAQSEAAMRADLLIEESDTVYCEISVVSGTAEYALNSLVYDVISARIGSVSLSRTSRIDMSRIADEYTLPFSSYMAEWETDTGTPTKFYVSNNKIRLVPIPTEDATLNLTVARMPVTIDDEPEISPMYHYRMLDWALHLAFDRPDADTENKALADKYEVRFAMSFGRYDSAKLQGQKRARAPKHY